MKVASDLLHFCTIVTKNAVYSLQKILYYFMIPNLNNLHVHCGIYYVLTSHSSPRRLPGKKNLTAIIIEQQFGFPISTT